MSKLLYGGISPEQIDIWKSTYGVNAIKLIEVPIDDTGKNIAQCIVRKPDLQIIAAASKFVESDPIKSGIVLFDNCWLGGNEIIKNDDELKMSVIEQLNTMFKVRQATLKNL